MLVIVDYNEQRVIGYYLWIAMMCFPPTPLWSFLHIFRTIRIPISSIPMRTSFQRIQRDAATCFLLL